MPSLKLPQSIVSLCSVAMLVSGPTSNCSREFGILLFSCHKQTVPSLEQVVNARVLVEDGINVQPDTVSL